MDVGQPIVAGVTISVRGEIVAVSENILSSLGIEVAVAIVLVVVAVVVVTVVSVAEYVVVKIVGVVVEHMNTDWLVVW